MQIKINDLAFQGDKSMSKYFVPKHFEWYRGPDSVKDNNTVVFTDSCLNMVDMPCYKNTKNIALIIEPSVIQPTVYQWITNSNNFIDFDVILTHHKGLLNLDKRFKWYPSAMSWIAENDWKKWDKTKNISIIASEKNYAPGHQLRHFIVNKLKQDNIKIDIFGKGYKPVEHKIEGMSNWRFNLAIENCQEVGYFTEKIIDCFATWTVPIYYGDPSIGNIFNMDGIIMPKSAEDIVNFCQLVSYDINFAEEQYNKRLKAIEENFEIAKNYRCAEDYIFEHKLIV